MRLVKNSAMCSHCGVKLVSVHVHDFVGHTCIAAGKISRAYDHDLQAYVPHYPYFAVDGGNEYAKRVGDPKDYIDTSEWTL